MTPKWKEILKLEKVENWNVILKGWSYPLSQKIKGMRDFTEALDDRLTNRQEYMAVSQHNNKLNEKIKPLERELKLISKERRKEYEARWKAVDEKQRGLELNTKERRKEDEWEKSHKKLNDLKDERKSPRFNKHSSINRIAILHDISQLDNPQYIIDEAKKVDINLQDPSILRHFLVEMQTSFNWDMEIFGNIKGLLPQEATSGGGDVDLTPKIKQVIQMLKHMNKPITQESVLDELGLDEQTWKEEYNELLRE